MFCLETVPQQKSKIRAPHQRKTLGACSGICVRGDGGLSVVIGRFAGQAKVRELSTVTAIFILIITLFILPDVRMASVLFAHAALPFFGIDKESRGFGR